MIMIKLSISLRWWLQEQPEYGMGYQRGVATLSTGTRETGVILNGSTFVKQDELRSMTPTDVAEAEAAAHMSRLSITNVELIPRSLATLRGIRRIRTVSVINQQKTAQYQIVNEVLRASQGAKDAPITATLDGEIFNRFSPYRDDFKITALRGLKPGTFATTAEDAKNVRTGREAVARYALENKQSANKRFTIKPEEKTRLQQGVVQPAYDEPGGGVEVIFVDGTCDHSVSEPDILPE